MFDGGGSAPRASPHLRSFLARLELTRPRDQVLGFAGAVLAAFESPPEDEVLSLDDDELLEELDDEVEAPSDFFELFEEDEYRSAYQPPPLRMKFPPLIWRFALDWLHFGQTSMGASEIFWISSHWFWQFVQTYSYVGMSSLCQCVTVTTASRGESMFSGHRPRLNEANSDVGLRGWRRDG